MPFQVDINSLFHLQRTFPMLCCLLKSTEKMPLGIWKPLFPLKSTKIWDMVGCSLLSPVFDGTAVALRHPACSPASTLAGHVLLPNPQAGLCFSQMVPVISKQTLCFKDWVMLLLSELLSLPLYKDDFLIIKKKAGKKNKQENKDCSTFVGNQLKFNLSSHANTFFFFNWKHV